MTNPVNNPIVFLSKTDDLARRWLDGTLQFGGLPDCRARDGLWVRIDEAAPWRREVPMIIYVELSR